MKNYFKSNDGYIFPFKKVIAIYIKDGYMNICLEKNIPDNWFGAPIEQLEDYKAWLEATSPEKYEITQEIPEERIKFIDPVLERIVEYPKKENITLTTEQVTKLMILFDPPIKCGNCYNAESEHTAKCLYCDDKNSELIPTDEFVARVNEAINKGVEQCQEK